MTVHLLANQGAIGGGETMLLRCATTLTDLGVSVEVVAPDYPDEVARAAAEAGLATRRIGGDSRGQYAARLAAWSRRSDGLLWAHGLLPA
ncbi:MAG: glycosyltransferase, partial [Nocardioides sp.]